MKFLAKGKRGIVYLKEVNGKKVVVKKENPKSKAINRIENEARFLQIVNKLGIGPKYISHNKEELVMEYIDGQRIDKFVEGASKKEILWVIKEILRQCFILDKSKIEKGEMTHPHKHIIITEKGPVMIDWERARKSIKPSNLTQFCQYLTSDKFWGNLKSKGITINKKEMRKRAKEYKESMSSEKFHKILNFLQTFTIR